MKIEEITKMHRKELFSGFVNLRNDTTTVKNQKLLKSDKILVDNQ